MNVVGTRITRGVIFLLGVSRYVVKSHFIHVFVLTLVDFNLFSTEFDPVGVFCIIDKGEFSTPLNIHEGFLLDDENYPLRNLEFNFRSKSQLLLSSSYFTWQEFC